MPASLGAEFMSELKIEEGSKLRISDDDHVSPVTSAATGRTRIAAEGLPVHRGTAIAPCPRDNKNLGLVDENHGGMSPCVVGRSN